MALVLIVVLCAGALFGYDQGVISGALEGLQRDFKLSPLLVGVVTSRVTLGALAGSLAGGEIADRLGRRRAHRRRHAVRLGRGGRGVGARSIQDSLRNEPLVSFVVSFGFSLRPVVWTVINEIFPGQVRGRAVAVATAVNWAAAFLVSQFFLTLVGSVGEAGAFGLFACFCVVGGAWIYRSVPETKGRSLEEIEALWEVAAIAPATVRSAG
ncbi:MAG: MFS transporter [Burkholderiales bacterium]